MSAHDLSNLLFAVILVGGAIFAALNLYLFTSTFKEVQELRRQNKELKLRLLECEENHQPKQS